MDLGFHLAMSYHYLKRPTSRKNFGDVVGQNHALILTQCHIIQQIQCNELTQTANFTDFTLNDTVEMVLVHHLLALYNHFPKEIPTSHHNFRDSRGMI